MAKYIGEAQGRTGPGLGVNPEAVRTWARWRARSPQPFPAVVGRVAALSDAGHVRGRDAALKTGSRTAAITRRRAAPSRRADAGSSRRAPPRDRAPRSRRRSP